MSRKPTVTFLPHSTPSSGVLKGCISQEKLAFQLDRNPKTLDRWEREDYGPPSFMIGHSRFYVVAEVRQWLLKLRKEGKVRGR